MHNNKWKESSSYFLSHVSNTLDKFIVNYDNIILIGDLNATMCDETMKDFCQMYSLHNHINVPTCYKNANNPSSIDVILTNRKISFQNSLAIETGLSDHHKMIITVLKSYFKKKHPVIKNYRSYKHFDEDLFRRDLKINLQNLNEEIRDYDNFKEIFMKVLNHHAPTMKKLIRGNNAPFMKR